MKLSYLFGAPALLVLAACGGEPGAASNTSQTASAVTVSNGIAFNGRAFNARSFNGRAFNARSFNGISFNGRAFNGSGYGGAGFHGVGANGTAFMGYSVSADDSELTLTSRTSRPRKLSFAALGGSVTLIADHSDPTMVATLRISGPNVVQGGRKPVLSYMVEVWDSDNLLWVPAYTDESDLAVATIPLNGMWNIAASDIGTAIGGSRVDDPDAITFAARGYTLAKCVELGYRAWNDEELHQTCVRAMRADYCGDGRSFTRDGMLIDIYDRHVLEAESSPPPGQLGQVWVDEANWNEDGATCLSNERIQDWAPGESPDPICFGTPLSAKYSSTCGLVNRRGSPIWADELIRTRHAGW